MKSDKPQQQPSLGTIEGAQITSFDPEVPAKPENPEVVQSQELTQEVSEGEDEVNGGVGPQPDEHRGNAQGGFKYEGSELKEEVKEEDGSGANGKNER
jgi:hypothetical protein